MMRRRLYGTRVLLGLFIGAAIGWAVSAHARSSQNTPPGQSPPPPAAADVQATSGAAACALGRWCTGTAGCATDCDSATSLIAGCARCEKGAYVGCSQGHCEPEMAFKTAATDEQLCPSQLMIPCEEIGEMCTIGRTSHRCQCSRVGGIGGLLHPKWICK